MSRYVPSRANCNPPSRCNSRLSNRTNDSSIYDSLYDHVRSRSSDAEPIYGNSDVIATSFETAVPSTYYHINTLKRVDSATANNKLGRAMSFSEPRATSTPNNPKFPWDYVRRSTRGRLQNPRVRRSCSFNTGSTVTPVSRVYVGTLPPPPCPHQPPQVQQVPLRKIENLAGPNYESVLRSIYASTRGRGRGCRHVGRSQSFSAQPRSNLQRTDSSTSSLSHTSFVTVYEKRPGSKPDEEDSGFVSGDAESVCSVTRAPPRQEAKLRRQQEPSGKNKRPATIAVVVSWNFVC